MTLLQWAGDHPVLSTIYVCVLFTSVIAITEQVFLGIAAIVRAFRNDT